MYLRFLQGVREMFVEKIHCFEFGEYRLDVTNNQLSRNAVPVSITQKSFEILLFLVENQGIVLKKEDLLDSLWEGDFVEESTLTQHVYMLRKALKKDGDELNYIETIPKIGYRFVGEVEEVFYENPNSQITVNHVYPDRTESVTTSINDEIVYFKSLSESGKISAYVEEKTKQLPAKKELKQPKNQFFLLFLVIVGFLLLGYTIYEKNFFLASQNAQNQDARIKSLAVLPFKIIGEGKDEKLGLGMADALISKLGNLEGLSVRPTSSVINFSEKENFDLFETGKNLEVDAILIGTIQKEKETVRITTQLFDVESKKLLWSERFDENYSDIFSLQDKISEHISSKLSIKIKTNNHIPAFAEFKTEDTLARFYLSGIYYLR